jgi:Na+/H+-dicarboxylate symporter
MTLTNKIFIAMAAGIAFGSIANVLPESAYDAWLEQVVFLGLFDVVGSIFVASLKLLVVPMVFVSLTCGTASLGSH